MTVTPITKKKAPSAAPVRPLAASRIAKEASVLRTHAEALHQAASDLEKAFSGGRGPHPPTPGPSGMHFAAVHRHLGAVLQSVGALHQPMSDLMNTEES